jgi:hypothetical protein
MRTPRATMRPPKRILRKPQSCWASCRRSCITFACKCPFTHIPPFRTIGERTYALGHGQVRWVGGAAAQPLHALRPYRHVTNMTANAYATFHEWVEPPAPKFPLLRRLHLEGCLTPLLGARDSPLRVPATVLGGAHL